MTVLIDAQKSVPSPGIERQIRRILEEQRFNERVEQWIEGLKNRSRIRRYVW